MFHHKKGTDEIEDTGQLDMTDIEKQTEDPPFACISKCFLEEVKTNLKMAFPVMITNIFQYSLTIETTSFCGRLTSTELEGVGLGLSIISAFGWCVITGMISSCDTMFAQSFGSENKKRTGLFLQRGFLLMNLIPIILWSLHINIEPILILLQQDPKISRVSGEFLIAFCPGLTFMVNYLLMARYLQDQGNLWPPVLAAICGNIFNICCQLLFVTYLEMGFKASAVSHSFSFGVMALFELLYLLKSKFYVATWPGFQLEAFYDWSGMFRLGLAGVGHITFEVIIWEASIFMGGLLGNVQLATQSIMIQLLTLLFMLYYGAGIASNIRVGQCLGANRPNQAKAAYRAGILSTAITVIIIATTLILLRNYIPYVFTDKKDIIDMTTNVFPFLFGLFFTDPFASICSGTMRGCGRQFSGAIIMLISFYVLCLPTSITLAFVFNQDIKGIWIGNTLGSATSVALCLILLECQSWPRQAQLAQQRIMCSSKKTRHSETEALLPTFHMDSEAKTILPSHIRTPSHPITCSIDVVKLPEPRLSMDRSILKKRAITTGAVILVFLCGLCIHLFLPVEIYRGSQFNATHI